VSTAPVEGESGRNERGEPRWFRRLDRWAAVGWRFVVVVVAIALVLWLVAQLRFILLPAVFSLFVCTVLRPVRNSFEAIGLPRAFAAVFAMLTALIVIGLVVLVIVPPIVSESEDIANSIGDAYDEIFAWLETGPFGLTGEQGQDLRRNVEDAQDAALQGAASGVVSGLPVALEVGAGLLLAIVVTFFFLRDGERIWEWSIGLLPLSEQSRARQAGYRVWRTLTRYLRGVAVVAVVDAVGIGAGAYLIGVPLAVPIAVLTFVMAFVPILGAVIAGLVAVLIAFAHGGVSDALWMLGVVLLVQQLEANILAPALIGRSVEIHPLIVLLGVAAGGATAGILGAILVTPLIAVIATLLQEYFGEQPASDDGNVITADVTSPGADEP
jgi:putative heme transporter